MSRRPFTFCALVLAAGTSRRLGRPKQLVTLDGTTLVRRAVLAAVASGAATTCVVVGDDEDVYASVQDLAVQRVYAGSCDEGLAASLRAGLAAVAADPDIHAALVVLCDQPALEAGHLRTLAESWRAHGGEAAVATRYAGVAGVPALFPRTWFPALLGLRGDAGARALLRGGGKVSRVIAIEAPLFERDIDRPEDLAGIN